MAGQRADDKTAVVLWMRDGSVKEVVFATLFLAELYLALVPFVVEPDGTHEVAAAMLSPLVETDETSELLAREQ